MRYVRLLQKQSTGVQHIIIIAPRENMHRAAHKCVTRAMGVDGALAKLMLAWNPKDNGRRCASI